MEDNFVPPSWFWIFVALLVACFIKATGQLKQTPPAQPPLSVFGFLLKG